jgi:hypothetical protein
LCRNDASGNTVRKPLNSRGNRQDENFFRAEKVSFWRLWASFFLRGGDLGLLSFEDLAPRKKICLFSLRCMSAIFDVLEVVIVGAKLKRKSFFVDEGTLRKAKKALGVKTDAEAVRLSVQRVAEMVEFWEFMQRSRQSLKPGSLAKP